MRQISLTDNDWLIDMTVTNTLPTTQTASSSIVKHNITAIDMYSDEVSITENNPHRPITRLKYTDVATPVVASASDLYIALVAMQNNIPSSGIFSTWGSFTDADLVDGITTWTLTINHLFATENVTVSLRNASNGLETSFPATVVDNATVTVEFGATIGAGTWHWILTATV